MFLNSFILPSRYGFYCTIEQLKMNFTCVQTYDDDVGCLITLYVCNQIYIMYQKCVWGGWNEKQI